MSATKQQKPLSDKQKQGLITWSIGVLQGLLEMLINLFGKKKTDADE